MSEHTSIHVLLLATDEGVSAQVHSAVSGRQDIATTSVSSVAAARQHTDPLPDVVLIHAGMADADLVDAVRQLVGSLPESAILPLVPVSDLSQMREAVLAGARGFVTLPIQPEELLSTIQQVVEVRPQRQRTPAPVDWSPPNRKGVQVIALVGAKGGAGRSTIAANLAILLAHDREKASNGRAALVDSQVALGDAGVLLNLQPTNTIADLLPRIEDLDNDLLSGVMSHHCSGLHVLHSAPTLNQHGEAIADHMENLLDRLCEIYQYVIVDTGPLSDPSLPVILERADRVVLVITPDTAALRRTILFLDAAQSSGYPMERIYPVVNKIEAKGGLTLDAIESRIGIEVRVTIPEDTGLTTFSVNRGVPLVSSHPRSAVAKSLRQLAHELTGVAKPSLESGTFNPLQALTTRLGSLFNRNQEK